VLPTPVKIFRPPPPEKAATADENKYAAGPNFSYAQEMICILFHPTKYAYTYSRVTGKNISRKYLVGLSGQI
jgi:hypothetical protein